jgi:hypothetical protein
MQSSTMSLFEREIRAQVHAARLAVAEAERREDLTLADAARAHLQSLVDLAHRNGVDITEEPIAAQAGPVDVGSVEAGSAEAGPVEAGGPELAAT